MLTLFDLSAEFWKNAYGGSEAMRGYELTLEKLEWYWRDSKRTVVCLDSPRSERREKYPAYKSTRKPKPQPALESLDGIIARARDWGMPLAVCDGWEADDVICTLTSQAWPEAVRIIGSEKDFFSLIDDRVLLVGKEGYIDANGCRDKFGVAPSQMTDWLALVGDASDCIPGCDHCGPARATDLLERFGSLAAIRAASDAELRAVKGIGEKTLAALRAWDPTAALDMIRMRDDLPLNLSSLLQRGPHERF